MEKKTTKNKSALDDFFKKHKDVAFKGEDLPAVERFSTGSISLDFVLDGGLPKGRIMEFFGPSGGGKSTLALAVLAACQREWKKNGEDENVGIYLDLERSSNPEYFSAIGVDLEKLIVLKPYSGEQAINMIRELLNAPGNPAKLFILDSLVGMVSAKEMDGDADDNFVAETARLNSRFLRSFAPQFDEKGSNLIVINQLRDNLNAVAFGKKTKTFGGKATEYFASIRIEIKKIGKIKSGDDEIGSKVAIVVDKSRFSPPGRKVETEIIFGEGFSLEGEIIDTCINEKILTKKGAYIYYNGESLGQGREAARKKIKESAELREELETKAREALAAKSASGERDITPEDEENLYDGNVEEEYA